ncbi:twin-arginine translocase TatA/TatE family subunit [Mesorhizobium australicum]|uniref:twin-arginine translocase TatA/TatE family subunit n=1 Tax=Mesorhizobium australicum TaxID=536018 RepID=UPI003339B90F
MDEVVEVEDEMGLASAWHWLIVGLILMLVFGRGLVSRLLGDIGSGIGTFKRTLRDGSDVRPVDHHSGRGSIKTVSATGRPKKRPATDSSLGRKINRE